MSKMSELDSLMNLTIQDVVDGNCSEAQQLEMNPVLQDYMHRLLITLWATPQCDCLACSTIPGMRKTYRDVHHVIVGMHRVLSGNPVFINAGWSDALLFLMDISQIRYESQLIKETLHVTTH